MKVQTKDISFRIGNKEILKNASFLAKSGQFVGIIGPNGSGKSSLLKNIYRFYRPDSGKVFLNDQDIAELSVKKTAKNLAVLHQESATNFEFSVKEIVLMGRAPHKGLWESDTVKDEKIVQKALQKVGLWALQHRSITTLSGGEKQRVMLARALAQQAQVLILDEPTNHLDIHYQLQLMELIKTLENTVITALHDLNIAAQYCDQIYVMNQGKIQTNGTPEEVLTHTTLREIFHVNADIARHPKTQKLHITYLSQFT